jgi:hypothetical protein
MARRAHLVLFWPHQERADDDGVSSGDQVSESAAVADALLFKEKNKKTANNTMIRADDKEKI